MTLLGILHDTARAYCNQFAHSFEEIDDHLTNFGFAAAASTLLCKTGIEVPWGGAWAPRTRQVFQRP